MPASSSAPKPSKKVQSKRGKIALAPLLYYVMVGGSSFYAGLMMGASSNNSDISSHSIASIEDCTSNEKNPERKIMVGKIKKQADRIDRLNEQLKNLQDVQNPSPGNSDDTERRFPKETSSFAGGMAVLDRTEFTKRFDIGVPIQQDSKGNENVLLLYSHEKAIPESDPFKAAEAKSNTKIPFMEDIDIATENCDILNLILTQPDEKQQCVAFLGQYRSYHMSKFMRLPEQEGEKLDRKAPLRLVNRGAQASGRLSHRVPSQEQTLSYWKTLSSELSRSVTSRWLQIAHLLSCSSLSPSLSVPITKVYLQNWDTALEELRLVAEQAAKNNTIVVMVCNHGRGCLFFTVPAL